MLALAIAAIWWNHSPTLVFGATCLAIGSVVGIVTVIISTKPGRDLVRASANINLSAQETIKLIQKYGYESDSAELIAMTISERTVSINYSRALALLLPNAGLLPNEYFFFFSRLHAAAGLPLHEALKKHTEAIEKMGLANERGRIQATSILATTVRYMADICTDRCIEEAIIPALSRCSFHAITKVLAEAKRNQVPITYQEVGRDIVEKADKHFDELLRRIEERLREITTPVQVS